MNTRQVKMFIGAMVVAATAAAGYAGLASHTLHAYYAFAVMVLAALTSRMKVKLPGINGNMSVNLPFLLTAVVNLSAAEAILVTCVSTAVQCWPRKNGKFNPQQMIFNLSMMSFATCMASFFVHATWMGRAHGNSAMPGLALAGLALFFGQTAPVAAIIGISEGKAAGSIWWSLAHLSFPYYAVSAGVCSLVQAASAHLGWPLALAMFPVMYGIYRSYRRYLEKAAESTVRVRVAAAGA